MKRMLKGFGVLIAALACAAVFGVGVPLLWVWLASKVQPAVGQGTSELAALIVIVGPLASYIALVVFAGRLARPRDGSAQPQRMAWNRSRDEVPQSERHTTTLDQVILLAVLFVGAGFEIWFFFFAHQRPWGS